jgi:hypothetical protein
MTFSIVSLRCGCSLISLSSYILIYLRLLLLIIFWLLWSKSHDWSRRFIVRHYWKHYVIIVAHIIWESSIRSPIERLLYLLCNCIRLTHASSLSPEQLILLLLLLFHIFLRIILSNVGNTLASRSNELLQKQVIGSCLLIMSVWLYIFLCLFCIKPIL